MKSASVFLFLAMIVVAGGFSVGSGAERPNRREIARLTGELPSLNVPLETVGRLSVNLDKPVLQLRETLKFEIVIVNTGERVVRFPPLSDVRIIIRDSTGNRVRTVSGERRAIICGPRPNLWKKFLPFSQNEKKVISMNFAIQPTPGGPYVSLTPGDYTIEVSLENHRTVIHSDRPYKTATGRLAETVRFSVTP